jgi:succinyl-CoA synthetase alpha subunit
MSILIDKSTKLIVQGITGRDGAFHTSKMKEYGTNVVGGTSPGKAGEFVDEIPVFNTVRDAVNDWRKHFGDFCAGTVCKRCDDGSCCFRYKADSMYH